MVGSLEGAVVGTGEPIAVGVGGVIREEGSAPDVGEAEGSVAPDPATPWRSTLDCSQPRMGSPQRGGM
jgi:hypothetical protein